MDLGHLERNKDLHDSPFHAGEDWNRGSSYQDKGDALIALADGHVVFIQDDPTAIP
ncbi:MAG: hypothetical protein KZQ96_21245 [Candidatus Thiodiazotropha sp. (ex Lucinoma borealis)]|nr:hypothetical protein [Candidatus Thiodiazotropha sp. (ex Lucinoma borealis)]